MKIIKYFMLLINNLITTKHIVIFLFSILIISLLPLIIVGFYNVPSSDDFGHSLNAYTDWVENRSLLNVAKLSIDFISWMWNKWAGLYSNILIPLTSPFYINNYWITAFITIIPLCFCSIFLSMVIFIKIFKADIWKSLLISIITSMLMIQCVSSPAESFYWLSGAVFYTTATALFFMIISFTILGIYSNSKKYKLFYIIFSSLIIILYSGMNFITTLASAGLFILMICFLLIIKNKSWKLICIPCFFAVLSLLLIMSAPGNSVRRFNDEHSLDPIAAIFKSLEFGLYGFWKSFDHIHYVLFLGVLFFLPFFIKIVINTNFIFKYPILVTLFSYLYFSSLMTPGFYGSGIPGYHRMLGVYLFFFMHLTIINVYYWVGWLTQKILNKNIKIHVLIQGEKVIIQTEKTLVNYIYFFFKKYKLIALFVFVILTGFFIFSSVKDGFYHKYSSPVAVKDLKNGTVKEYYFQYQCHLKALKNPNIKDVILEPFTVFPIVCFSDGTVTHILKFYKLVYKKDSVVFLEHQL